MNRTIGGILAAFAVVVLLAGGGERLGKIGSTTQTASENQGAPEQTQRKSTSSEPLPSPAGTQDGFSRQLGRLVNELRDTSAQLNLEQLPDDVAAALKDVRIGPASVLVATVPHPTRTHLALFADRMIEAIQQAVQANGYRFDRALMPWETREIVEPDDIRKLWAQEDVIAGLYRVPGIMIFRWGGSADIPAAQVIVLLVAEKPTAGIDRVQFATAVEIARGLGSKGHLLVLGPTFSGSLPSMADLLETTAVGFARVTVASGTVTGPDAITAFQARLNKASSAGKFQFTTFQYDDGYAMRALVKFGCEHWKIQPEEMALVSESETEYGQPYKRTTSEDDPTSKFLKLHFPRGISHLRTAYEQQQKLQAAADPTLRAPSAVLRVPLGGTRRGADSVPVYASQSAISQDSILTGIIQELAFRRPRLALVLATDPLDTLFLIRYIRGHYPQARVVTMTADSLLRHEADDPLLRGVLTLTTYSLRPATGEYLQTSYEPGAGVFANSDAKGAYNAAAALIACVNRPGSAWCRHTPHALVPGEGLFEYDPSWFAPKAKRGLPDLKLDVLGADDFFPVASLRACNMPKQMAVRESDGKRLEQVYLWTPMVTVLVVVGFAALISLLSLLWRCSAVFCASDAPNALAPTPRGALRHGLIAVFCAFAYLFSLLPLWPLFHLTGVYPQRAYVFAAWLLLAAGGIVLLRRHYSLQAAWILAGVLAAAAAGILSLRGYLSDSPALRAFIYRWWHADSGVSLLVPVAFLLVALLWALYYRLLGTTLVETQLPELPDIARDGGDATTPTLPDAMIEISRGYQQKLKRFMLPLMEWRRLTLPLGLASFFIAIMCGWKRLFTTFEAYQFDYAFTGLSCLAIWLLTAELVRMLLVWLETKRLLRALANQPFSEGFTKVRFSWRQLTRLTVQQMKALRADPWLFKDRPLLWDSVISVRDQYVNLLRKHIGMPPLPAKKQAAVSSSTDGSREAGAPGQPGPATRLSGEDAILESFGELKRQLADTAASLCRDLSMQMPPAEAPPSDKAQQERPSELAVARVGENGKLEFVLKDSTVSSRDKSVHFVCLLYTNYLVAVLLRIRTMAVSAAGVFVLFALAMMSYPFEPRGLIRSLMIVVFAAMMSVIAIVYAQMHRDETLSRITNTPAGQLGGDFWFRMVGFVGLPLISLLASQFPSIGKFLFSWVEPAVRSIR